MKRMATKLFNRFKTLTLVALGTDRGDARRGISREKYARLLRARERGVQSLRERVGVMERERKVGREYDGKRV